MLKKVPPTTVVCPGLINAIALSSIDEHVCALCSQQPEFKLSIDEHNAQKTQTQRDESKKAVEALILYQSQQKSQALF